MGRSKRVRVSAGIYRDSAGYSVEARIGSGDTARRSGEIRFPFESSPDDYKNHLATMQARHLREKAKLTEERGTPAKRGTLAGDVALYFKTAKLTAQRADERRHQLDWWIEKIGADKSRGRLEPGELRRILNTLKRTASTRNKYRTALSNMYTVLDGKSAANPFRDVERDTEPDAARRDQPTIVVDAILAEMRERGAGAKTNTSRTRARFMVLAYAPVTNAQLCRMTESDVDLERAVMYPPGRQKGTGTKAQAKALEPDAVAAFRAFAAAGCWTAQAITPPSRSSMRRTFNAARDRAIAKLLKTRPELAGDLARAKTMRPYDLRHSYAFAVVQATSLDTARLLLDHSDSRTTLRYAQGAIPEHLKAARDAIAAQRARDRQPTK